MKKQDFKNLIKEQYIIHTIELMKHNKINKIKRKEKDRQNKKLNMKKMKKLVQEEKVKLVQLKNVVFQNQIKDNHLNQIKSKCLSCVIT